MRKYLIYADKIKYEDKNEESNFTIQEKLRWD